MHAGPAVVSVSGSFPRGRGPSSDGASPDRLHGLCHQPPTSWCCRRVFPRDQERAGTSRQMGRRVWGSRHSRSLRLAGSGGCVVLAYLSLADVPPSVVAGGDGGEAFEGREVHGYRLSTYLHVSNIDPHSHLPWQSVNHWPATFLVLSWR